MRIIKNKFLIILISLLSVTADFSFGQDIHTLTAGTLTVAVTTEAPESEFDPQLWIRQYIEEFADKNQLSLSWVLFLSMNLGFSQALTKLTS